MIPTDSTKHKNVLVDIDSLNISILIRVNVITPIPKPINREGHISPPYA